ncbi:MAG: DUF2141 domain-containing protein [Candidatus Puniceispirillales bacterium]
MNNTRIFLAVVLLSLGVITPLHAADLTVTVRTPRTAEGELLAVLRDDSHKHGYLDTEDNIVQEKKQKASETMLVFAGLDPGTYSLALFHDENSNGELDTVFFGIPTEGHGFSNNASAPFGPPDFNATAFEMTGEDQHMTVDLRYLVNPSAADQPPALPGAMLQQMQTMFQGADNTSAMDITAMIDTVATSLGGREGGPPVFIGFAFANFAPISCSDDAASN